jgi:hypothetical protein
MRGRVYLAANAIILPITGWLSGSLLGEVCLDLHS